MGWWALALSLLAFGLHSLGAKPKAVTQEPKRAFPAVNTIRIYDRPEKGCDPVQVSCTYLDGLQHPTFLPTCAYWTDGWGQAPIRTDFHLDQFKFAPR